LQTRSEGKPMSVKFGIAIAAALIASGSAVATMQGQGVKRTDLQRHDLSIDNRETVQARIDIAPGATAPWHRHPGEEVIYVIEGTLEYQLEGKSPATFKAGEVLFIPAGVAHKAHNLATPMVRNSQLTSLKRVSRL
jgi:quercetin dioxygenase-like cupin family protein